MHYPYSRIVVQAQLAEGPFDQIIIRGVTLINGNGAPPLGPVDVVVEKNVITQVKTVGYPGLKSTIKEDQRIKSRRKGNRCRGHVFTPWLYRYARPYWGSITRRRLGLCI